MRKEKKKIKFFLRFANNKCEHAPLMQAISSIETYGFPYRHNSSKFCHRHYFSDHQHQQTFIIRISTLSHQFGLVKLRGRTTRKIVTEQEDRWEIEWTRRNVDNAMLQKIESSFNRLTSSHFMAPARSTLYREKIQVIRNTKCSL